MGSRQNNWLPARKESIGDFTYFENPLWIFLIQDPRKESRTRQGFAFKSKSFFLIQLSSSSSCKDSSWIFDSDTRRTTLFERSYFSKKKTSLSRERKDGNYGVLDDFLPLAIILLPRDAPWSVLLTHANTLSNTPPFPQQWIFSAVLREIPGSLTANERGSQPFQPVCRVPGSSRRIKPIRTQPKKKLKWQRPSTTFSPSLKQQSFFPNLVHQTKSVAPEIRSLKGSPRSGSEKYDFFFYRELQVKLPECQLG